MLASASLQPTRVVTGDRALVRAVLIAMALAFLGLFLLHPLAPCGLPPLTSRITL